MSVSPHESQPSPLRESSANAELIQTEEVNLTNFVSRVCNHEAKLLTILTLAQADNPLTAWHLYRGLTDPQRSVADTWTPGPRLPAQYVIYNLMPAGVVMSEETMGRQGPTDGYRLTDFGRTVAVPTAGLLLDWSSRYLAISLQDALGPTSTSGSRRAAETRVRILWEAVTNPQAHRLSIKRVADQSIDTAWDSDEYKMERARVRHSLDALQLAGIVNFEDTEFNDDRAFLIIDPSTPDNLHTSGDRIADVFYEVILQAHANKPHDEDYAVMTVSETILGVLESFERRSGYVDPIKVRAAVQRAYHHPLAYAGVEKISLFNDGYATRFSIAEEHREAVTDLLGILDALEHQDPTTINRGFELTQLIIDDPLRRAAIMNKTYEFSPYAQRRRLTQTARELEAIMQEAAAEMHIEEITLVYRALHRRPIKQETVRIVLSQLVEQGRATTASSPIPEKPGFARSRNFYSIADLNP